MVGYDGLWHRVYHTSIYIGWVHDWNPNQADFEETLKTPNFPSNFSNWWNQTHLFPSWAVAAIYSCASKYSMIFSIIIDWWVYPHAVSLSHDIRIKKPSPSSGEDGKLCSFNEEGLGGVSVGRTHRGGSKKPSAGWPGKLTNKHMSTLMINMYVINAVYINDTLMYIVYILYILYICILYMQMWLSWQIFWSCKPIHLVLPFGSSPQDRGSPKQNLAFMGWVVDFL